MDPTDLLRLAHQGGWDELLWFAAPIVAVFAWVRWAERKARTRAVDDSRHRGEPGEATAGPTLPGHATDPRKP
jgi:hypothetical protein